MLGALAAASWLTTVELMSSDTAPGQAPPALPAVKVPVAPPTQPENQPAPTKTEKLAIEMEKPGIARLQESDVIRTLSGILTTSGIADLTRLGWPTLRAASPLTTFPNAMREMSQALSRRSAANAAPILAVIGEGVGHGRSIVTSNVALAAARDGARVLVIDADRENRALSNKLTGSSKPEAKRLGWLSIGRKASRAIKTANGIEILPVIGSTHAIRKALTRARASDDYDLIIVDGPAMPFSTEERELIDVADGLAAVLPASLDINGCMDDIIAALRGARRKLIGVIIDELQPAMAAPHRSA